ncbi:MAG: mannitol/fructose-specific phosphotransferase system IIA component (Ntr-type) [Verrucomicrobiales bacterium]|jgi:mannitol/fructose-specific phosphotransferase system IIA component (Ntr-type)
MNLASLLTEEQIVPAVRAIERWPAIVELVDHLCSIGRLPEESKAHVLQLLQEREDKTSTGIGSGVAIPHAFAEEISEVITVFGRSKEGIEFDSIDNAPVQFIILFIVPKNEYQMHLRTLAAIAKMFNDSRIRKRLAAAETPAELLSILDSKPARG